MKRIILTIIAILFLGTQVWAADGTCTQTVSKFKTANPEFRVLTFSCTASTVNGSFPAIATTTATNSEIIGWYITEVRTNPGTAAPTDDYDIVINDSDGIDLMGGRLADRDATNSEATAPAIATGVFWPRPIDGALSLVITNNSVTSATMTIKVFLSK